MITVSALTIYPIKGCRGIALEHAEIQDIGLKDDRRFMVIDADQRFVSQREVPRMALITVAAHPLGWTLSAPGMETVSFTPTQSGAPQAATIWRDTATVVTQGHHVADWLSTFLGAPLQLVAMHPGYRRPVSSTYAKSPDDAVSFADGYASLIANQASLDELNQRLSTPINMDRFRPNIVVSGAEAWAEDDWHALHIGDTLSYAVKPCARCVVTTTDQATATRGQEPLRTLASYRTRELGVIFGQNLIHTRTGTIRVGDVVRFGP
jgi:uncharacterized protein YcbX